MYNLNVTPQFKRDANRCKRQGKEELIQALDI